MHQCDCEVGFRIKREWRVPAYDARHRSTHRARRLIQLAKTNGFPVKCYCTEEGELLIPKAIDGTAFLSAPPIDGNRHRCGHFGLGAHSPSSQIRVPAIDDTGTDYAVVMRTSPRSAGHREKRVRQGANDESVLHFPRRGKLQPAQLAVVLMERVGCCAWSPGKNCSNAQVMGAIREVVSASTLEEVPADDYVHVAVDGDEPARWEAFQSHMSIRLPRGGWPPALLIGEVTSLEATGNLRKLKLKGLDEDILISTLVWEQTKKRYWRAALRTGNPRDTRVVAVVTALMGSDGRLRVTAVGLVLLSRQFVPVDSRWEARMANGLARCGIAFRKPLKPLPGEKYIPDFELLGLSARILIEVWGFRNAKYRRKKTKKIRSYQRKKVRLIEWDAARTAPIRDALDEVEEVVVLYAAQAKAPVIHSEVAVAARVA